jgi:hypothetical protein
LDFDGIDDWVALPAAAINNLPSGTIEIWIRRLGPQTSNTWHGASGSFHGAFLAKQHDYSDTYAYFGFSDSTNLPKGVFN